MGGIFFAAHRGRMAANSTLIDTLFFKKSYIATRTKKKTIHSDGFSFWNDVFPAGT